MRKLLMGGLLAVTVALTSTPARAVEEEDIKRAVDLGVAALRRMQTPDGKWPNHEIGATALAGLTLLECGAAADDRAVLKAAKAVREASVAMVHTYSISVSILFLDRLGDAEDVPLIESLTVRLMAGQDREGGWSYECPPVSPAEARRLQAIVDQRKELIGRREPPRPGNGKKTIKDLPEEIRQQIDQLEKNPAGTPQFLGRVDNSNTQFAALGLWAGRRYGLPVERALQRMEKRFRATQNIDGGWSYTWNELPPNQPMPAPQFINRSTASMTCAGLLCLAVSTASLLEINRDKADGKPPRDLSKDAHLTRGLQAIAAVIDNPKNIRIRQGWRGGPPPGPGRPPVWEGPRGGPPNPGGLAENGQVGGRTYYFLWSLERVAVALGLPTIGKKDWYGWGAEILLLNQQADGTWAGEFANCGADTCFALLFLKQANLARDLSAELKGRLKDPGQRVIRAGGIGGDSLRGNPQRVQAGIESKNSPTLGKPLQEPKLGNSESDRLVRELLRAKGGRQVALLEQLRQGKGVQYTEALAAAIPRLDGATRRQAREALAERLTRMKEETLASYLQDEEAEIRRAAALACAMKESKALVPHLIALLRDPEAAVAVAAHAALKELTGQDFGPSAEANRQERDQASLQWLRWWNKQQK